MSAYTSSESLPKGTRISTLEGLGERHIGAVLDRGDPLADEILWGVNRIAATDQDSLMEDGVRPGEVHHLPTRGGDALPAQHGIGFAALSRRHHVHPRHANPLQRSAQLGRRAALRRPAHNLRDLVRATTA